MLYKTIYNEIYTEDFNGNKIGYIRFENVGMGDFKTLRDVIDYIEGKLQ